MVRMHPRKVQNSLLNALQMMQDWRITQRERTTEYLNNLNLHLSHLLTWWCKVVDYKIIYNPDAPAHSSQSACGSQAAHESLIIQVLNDLLTNLKRIIRVNNCTLGLATSMTQKCLCKIDHRHKGKDFYGWTKVNPLTDFYNILFCWPDYGTHLRSQFILIVCY